MFIGKKDGFILTDALLSLFITVLITQLILTTFINHQNMLEKASEIIEELNETYESTTTS